MKKQNKNGIAEREKKMKYYEVCYYRSYHWIDRKYLKMDCGDPATKAKVRNITSINEITETEYKTGLERKRASAQAKRERFISIAD